MRSKIAKIISELPIIKGSGLRFIVDCRTGGFAIRDTWHYEYQDYKSTLNEHHKDIVLYCPGWPYENREELERFHRIADQLNAPYLTYSLEELIKGLDYSVSKEETFDLVRRLTGRTTDEVQELWDMKPDQDWNFYVFLHDDITKAERERNLSKYGY